MQATDRLSKLMEKIDADVIEDCGIGLLSGKTGISLLYYYYYLYSSDYYYYSRGKEILNDVSNIISRGYKYPTFCDGISGYCWSIRHLHTIGMADRNDLDHLNAFDDFLCSEMLGEIKNGSFDYLHSSLGYVLNFIDRDDFNKFSKVFEVLIDQLKAHRIVENDNSFRWDTVYESKPACVLGLAHGMSSIIFLLSKLYLKGIKCVEVKELLLRSIDFIQKQRISYEKFDAKFPLVVCNNNEMILGRRIGWCNGELTLGTSMYYAAEALGDRKLSDSYIENIHDLCNITDVKKEHLDNISICHGMTGISLIYQVLHLQKPVELFKSTSERWLNASFNYYFANEESFINKSDDSIISKEKRLSLLDGLSGLAFTELTSRTGSYKWTSSLLLC
ncbi:MAG: lanthionine synthetase LanC family protein [Bacteroidota bacterium]